MSDSMRRVYPFPFRNPHLKELYDKKNEQNYLNSLKKKIGLKDIIVVFSLVVASIAVLSSAYFATTVQDTRTKAKGNIATFTLFPKQQNVIKGQNFYLVPQVTTSEDKKIGTMILSVKFSPQYAKIIGMQKESQQKLKSVQNTPFEEANSSGLFNILLKSEDMETAPSGTINLPWIEFMSVSEGISSINLQKGELAVIFTTEEQAQIELETPFITVFSR